MGTEYSNAFQHSGNESGHPPGISSLPAELWSIICALLPTESLKCFALANKRGRDSALPFLFNAWNASAEIDVEAFERKFRVLKYATSLTYSGSDHSLDWDKPYAAACLSSLVSRLVQNPVVVKRLRTLRIHNVDISDFRNATKFLTGPAPLRRLEEICLVVDGSTDRVLGENANNIHSVRDALRMLSGLKRIHVQLDVQEEICPLVLVSGHKWDDLHEVDIIACGHIHLDGNAAFAFYESHEQSLCRLQINQFIFSPSVKTFKRCPSLEAEEARQSLEKHQSLNFVCFDGGSNYRRSFQLNKHQHPRFLIGDDISHFLLRVEECASEKCQNLPASDSFVPLRTLHIQNMDFHGFNSSFSTDRIRRYGTLLARLEDLKLSVDDEFGVPDRDGFRDIRLDGCTERLKIFLEMTLRLKRLDMKVPANCHISLMGFVGSRVCKSLENATFGFPDRPKVGNF